MTPGISGVRETFPGRRELYAGGEKINQVPGCHEQGSPVTSPINERLDEIQKELAELESAFEHLGKRLGSVLRCAEAKPAGSITRSPSCGLDERLAGFEGQIMSLCARAHSFLETLAL